MVCVCVCVRFYKKQQQRLYWLWPRKMLLPIRYKYTRPIAFLVV